MKSSFYSRLGNVLLGLLLSLTMACEEGNSINDNAMALVEIPKQSVVFIAGYDEGKGTYYKSAKAYFQKQKMTIIDSLYSLKEIKTWLQRNHEGSDYDTIHIISHSNAWRGMSLKTEQEGERVTVETLKQAQRSGTFNNSIPQINAHTQIIFHSCGLGENTALMEQLKQVFTAKEAPQIIASPYFNVFQGKYAGHYLAKPYYGYYPTAQSEGPRALADAFKVQYPDKTMDWFKAVKLREEGQVGEVYSYKFNIPISWIYTFDDPEEIPQLDTKDAIMDWIVEDPEFATTLLQMNIPIERYRWTSRIVDNELRIYGKTTVVCVMEPVMDPQDPTEYETPCIENNNLYKRV